MSGATSGKRQATVDRPPVTADATELGFSQDTMSPDKRKLSSHGFVCVRASATVSPGYASGSHGKL